jgi:hypothetical protein
MNYPYSGMLCLMLVGREIFRLHTFIPIPTQPGFSGYFFLSLSWLKNPIYMGARIPII